MAYRTYGDVVMTAFVSRLCTCPTLYDSFSNANNLRLQNFTAGFHYIVSHLGDCCPDYRKECHKSEWDYLTVHRRLARREIINKMSCNNHLLLQIYPKRREVYHESIRMLAKCPEIFTYARDYCEKTFNGLIYKIPVCHPSSNLIYMNIYCAICNELSLEDIVPFRAIVPECPPWTNALLVDHDPKGRIPRGLPINCSLTWQVPSACARTASAMRCFRMSSNPQCWAYRNPVKGPVYNYANQFCDDVPSEDLRCYPTPQFERWINYTIPLFTSIIEIKQGIPTLRFQPMVNNNQENHGNSLNVMFILNVKYVTAAFIRNGWQTDD